jgi:6-pyruvoyltetrahydropterin/6-carboxytetrahydropterin synthase
MLTETKLSFEYAHRFLEHKGEAQYLHGHHGELTVWVGDTIDGRGFVVPVKNIQRIVWEVMQNFDHALLLQDIDPLLQPILDTYTKQGIRNGTPDNTTTGAAFKCDLGYAIPDCRLVVTKEITTCENFIRLFHLLLKDKLNIKRMRFQSNADKIVAAEQEF